MVIYMYLLEVAFKSVFGVIYLFFVTKIFGKKQISQLNVFDYIIGITLGNLAAEMAVNKEITIWVGMVSIGVYGLFSLAVSIGTMRSITLRRYITGTPIIVLENGKILRDKLKDVKIDVDDLLQEARENGYFDISQIEYAIMEPSGKLSFLPKSKYVPLTPNDAKIKVNYKGLCANLVIDGVIMKENLKNIKKDEKWLLTRLKKLNYEKVEDLLLVTCDSEEKLSVFEKDIKEESNAVLE
jgi:uncharacterized membrane protein YcaP (DUF421 family)